LASSKKTKEKKTKEKMAAIAREFLRQRHSGGPDAALDVVRGADFSAAVYRFLLECKDAVGAPEKGARLVHALLQEGLAFGDVVDLFVSRAELGEGDERAFFEGKTALMAALFRGHMEAVQKLLDAGGSVHLEDSAGTPALLWAVSGGQSPELVALLLAHGAAVECTGRRMGTPLTLAATMGATQTLQLLLDNGAAIDRCVENVNGKTALTCAAGFGNYRATKLLLDHGADATLVDQDGKTALMCAVSYNNRDVIELLLGHDCKLDAQDTLGRTAAMYATSARNLEICAVLLNAGANPELEDNLGRTVWTLVREIDGGAENIREYVAMARDWDLV
jgi:ankyrin repeat protein